MADYDVIIVGAGHNGLVAAIYLARAGWSTLVLERNERIGGAVRSGEVTRPDFIHDLYSTNHNLFRASPVYQELKEDLKRHGLEYAVTTRPFCNLFPDGTALRVYADAERTREELQAHNAADAEGWFRLYDRYKAFGKALLPLYNTTLPSLQAAGVLTKAVAGVGLQELSRLAQIVLSSTRELGEAYFETEEARALLATWGLHLDYGPDVSGGAMFPLLSTFSTMENGMSVARGGASRMVEALASILQEHGGEIRTQAEVRRILVENGKGTGVELASGEQIRAGRAIVANLTPAVLFGELLAEAGLPDAFRRKVRNYHYGPATMMLHLALSGRPQWIGDASLEGFGYVHIPPYVEDLARTYTQAVNGYLPDEPLTIVGQTSQVDPSRTPEGQELLWVQVRTLPRHIKGDAAGAIEARDWQAAGEPFADRVMEKLERYATGIGELVLERTVLSPDDLERDNANLVDGDSLSGSHHVRQYFLWRPFADWSTYRTPLDGVFMVGAATWPGAGTNAASGYLAAQEILHPHATRNRLLAGGAAAGAGALGLAYLLRQVGKGANGER